MFIMIQTLLKSWRRYERLLAANQLDIDNGNPTSGRSDDDNAPDKRLGTGTTPRSRDKQTVLDTNARKNNGEDEDNIDDDDDDKDEEGMGSNDSQLDEHEETGWQDD